MSPSDEDEMIWSPLLRKIKQIERKQSLLQKNTKIKVKTTGNGEDENTMNYFRSMGFSRSTKHIHTAQCDHMFTFTWCSNCKKEYSWDGKLRKILEKYAPTRRRML